MEKTQIIPIALLISGTVFVSVSLGLGVMSLKEDYWIDYALTTTTTTTISSFPATIVAVTKANIGLFTTCYNVDTTTTISTGFSTSTSNSNSNGCVDTETTGYIGKDTVEMIQEVGKAAAAIVGLALISGIAVLVLVFLKKLAKPVCFASLTPVVLALLSTVMILAAILILKDELKTGMTFGDTAIYGYIATGSAFLSTVMYSVAAVFIIKSALTVSKTTPLEVIEKPEKENTTLKENI